MPEPNKIVKLFEDIAGNSFKVYIEQVSGYIGTAHPGSRMFNFGEGYGFLKGVLSALHYPIIYVSPRTWMRKLNLQKPPSLSKVKWKRYLKQWAQQLYPYINVTLKTADALLILEYAKQEEKNDG